MLCGISTAYAADQLISSDTSLTAQSALLTWMGVDAQFHEHYNDVLCNDGLPQYERELSYMHKESDGWYSNITTFRKNALQQEIDLISAGGGGGGHAIDPPESGGGGSGLTFHTTYYKPSSSTRPPYLCSGEGTNIVQWYVKQQSGKELLPRDINVSLNGLSFTGLPEGEFSIVYTIDPSYGTESNHRVRLDLYFFTGDPTLTNYSDGVNDDYVYKYAWNTESYGGYILCNYVFDGSNLTLDCSESIALSKKSNAGQSYYATTGSGKLYCYTPYGGGSGSGGGDNPSGGGGDNPSGGGDDEPSDPEPPEIDPTEYNTYTTNNTDIDVNITFDNDGGQTDLTPITLRLDRIYARLGDIGNDLLNFDQHMQTAFYNLQSAINGLFSSYFGATNKWLEMIYDRVNDINRQMGYLDKSTDDLTDLSGVQNYLMQILSTLQGMGNNSPAADPTDLSGVLHELGTIEDLLRDINKPTSPRFSPTIDPDDDDGIGKQITDKSVELAKKFPFSIPWDVHKILSMFEAEPVAPQFDLPVFGMDDEVHIDMSSWEPVAVVTRNATTILFALGLALRTRTMIGGNND